LFFFLRVGVGNFEVREHLLEQVDGDGSTVGVGQVSEGSVRRDADAKAEVAGLAHHGAEGDVDDVVDGATAVGVAGGVTSEHTNGVLGSRGGDGGGGVEAHHLDEFTGGDQFVEAGDSGKEDGHQVLSGEVGGGQGGEAGPELGVDGGLEEDGDDFGEGGVGNKIVQLTILSRGSARPLVFVRETDEELVDQRVAKARPLAEGVSLGARCGPHSDDGIIAGQSEASLGHLEGQKAVVRESDVVVGRVIGNTSGEVVGVDGNEVDPSRRWEQC